MLRIRRLVAYTALAGLFTAGAVGVSIEAAHANFAFLCSGSGTTPSCTLTATIASPSAITVTVTATTNELATVNWTVSCTDSNGTAQTSAPLSSMTPITDAKLTPLPPTADGQCNVTAVVSLAASTASNPMNAVLDFTPSGTPTPTPTASSTSPAAAPPVHPIKGFDGKCVSDKGNSSANRTKIIIWNCSSTDQAENWTFSNNEFTHNGKCMNDQGNGGIRSKVILWTCNGASNEKWNERANGELQLQGHGGTLCVDDPRSSTTNGTQLILYTCTDAANQRWSLP
jgi:hypothetical protein